MEINKKLQVLLSLMAIACLDSATSGRLKTPVLCGLTICEPGPKFNYSTNVQYVYEYNAETSSLFRGTIENSSTLYVRALVHLSFMSPCQGKIRVTDVVLSEKEFNIYDSEENVFHPNSDAFAEAISKYQLRFSFNDGTIEEICPSESEPVWVLNFKRGILSAFHTTLNRFDIDHESFEADVNGHCLTQYRLQKAKGSSLLIYKAKNLDSCDSRNEYHTIIQANHYRFGSDFQTVPLVKSRQKCQLMIDHNIYKGIDCEEIHTFQPFSKDENGSQTIIRQSFELISETQQNSTEPELISKRTNLLFDHRATPKPTSGELKASRDLIKLLCQLNADDVQDGYAEAFAQFIQTARRLSHSALSLIYNRAGSICSTGRKHVMDAFSYIGSNVAVAIMTDAILQNSVPDSTAHEWLLSIAFIPRPDDETISLVVPLIDHPRARNESQYLFSVSSLIHTYCKRNSSCQRSEHIQRFLKFLETKVQEGCSRGLLNRDLQTKALIILKSLGNAGLTTFTLSNQLKQCIENEEVNMAVRVAAIQSNRRLPCSFDRTYYLDVYKNSSFDTELRIASYLEVMRCPTYFVTTVVRKILEEEEVNQVGSFVWSHLNNLLKSSALNKVEIQSLLTDKNLSEKFNMDRRKFSRNYEHSIFLDDYNVGGNIESNIIFSPKSYLPRSGMLNVTVDMFGRSVNVLEIDARLEGFEHVLEYAFGPGGPFSASEVGSKLDKLSRVIRAVPDKILEPHKQFPNVIDNNFKIPKISVGVKIFGNEISYSDVVGHPEFNNLLDKINPELRIRQLFSGKEINFNKAAMFFDADYNVPTGLGFPLILTATGTAATSLNVAGNIKSLHLLAFDVQGKFRPSVAVDVTGRMGIDAFYASTGIKLKVSLHSSTAVDGHVKIEGTTFAKVSFNLPKEKADIITVQSQLIVVRNDAEEIQSGITDNRVNEEVCSWPSLDHTLGLKLCSSIAFPNATKYLNDEKITFNFLKKRKADKTSWLNFLLNGPAKFALVLYKADPTAKEYILQYNWVHEAETTTISLVYDTPHSQQKRELSARLLLNKSSRNLTLLLRAVDNKFEAYGKYKYTPSEKYLDFALDVNGKKQFIAQIGLRTKEVKYGFIYQPKLFLAVNEERVAELSGTVKIIEKNEINQCDVNLEFQTKKLSTKLFGYISRGSSSFSADLKLSYHFSNPEYVRIALKWVNKSSKSLIQFNGEFTLDTSAYKHFNFDSLLKYQRAQGHAECIIEINTQPQLKNDAHKFTIKFVFSLSKSFNRTKLHTYIEITKPITQIDLKLEFKVDINHHGHDDKSTTTLLLRYATGKEIISTLDLSLPRSEMFKLDAKLNVTLPSFVPMIITTRVDEKKTREYDIEVTIAWFNGHNLTGKGIYIDKSEGVVTSHSIKLFLQSPSFNDVAIIGKLMIDDIQFKIDLQADHNNEKYSVLVKHASQSPLEIDLYGEIRYKTSIYSLTTIVNLMKQRQVLVELHLDQYRDIHVTLNGVNIPSHKQAGIEIKWDANRDPSQRFEALVRFLHPRALNYSLDFSMSYPGRLIKGNALFAAYGTRFDSSASMEWNPNEIIDVTLGAVYQNQKGRSLKISSQLLTPFAGWKRTSLNTGIHRENNQVRLNGTVWWQDNQTVSLDIFGDYDFLKKTSFDDDDYSDFDLLLRPDIPDLWVEFRASLISTVEEVKPVSAAFKHKQNNNCFNTVVHLKGQTNQLVSVNSTWELMPSPNSTNISGTVLFLSPYKGYEKGVLVGRLYYTIDLDIHGVAELDLDRKKYGAIIDGYIKSIKDNRLVIDVSTPLDMYSKITGKLGYSEVHRHLMCLWESPSSSIGFEILFDFRHAALFDLKFLIATPFEFFSRLLLRGKLNTEMADFKTGLNHLLLGFEGYWMYESLGNLDYKYILYTPLEGFRENGVVARILCNENIDVELSLRVAEIKVGAMVNCGHETKNAIDLKGGDRRIEEEDKLFWEGHIQVDTYFYPTVTGNLDIKEEEDTYTVVGDLKILNGSIDLFDSLNFEDIFNIKNKLFINASFEACKQVKSDFVWDIMLGEYHIIEFDIDVFTYSESKKGHLMINYTIEAVGESEDEEEYDSVSSGHKIHRSVIRLDTPWKEFPTFDLKGLLETEDNTYKTNLTVRTNHSYFSGTGNLEFEDDFIAAGIGMVMVSPTYNIPEFKLSAKRELTRTDKNFDVLLLIKSPVLKTYHLELISHFELPNVLRLRGKIETPIDYLKKAETMLSYMNNPEEKRWMADSRLFYHPNLEIKLSALKKDKLLSFDAESPLRGFEKVHFAGSIVRDGYNGNIINGKLSSDRVSYNVEGTYETSEASPLSLSISMKPQTEGLRSATTSVTVARNPLGYEFQGSLQHGHDRLTAEGKLQINPENSYEFSILMGSTYPELRHLDVSVNAVQTENGIISLDLKGRTPWRWVETVHGTASYLRLERTGRIRANVVLPKITGFADCDYTWSYMERMEFLYNAGYKAADVSEPKYVKGEIFYRNPGKNFKYLTAGVDNDVNGFFTFGVNGTLQLPVFEDVKVSLNLKLPPPQPEIHSVVGKLRYAQGFSYIAQTFKYSNEMGGDLYGTSGEVSYNKSDVQGNLKLEWGKREEAKAITNVFLMKRRKELLDVQYNLHTPYHREDTVLAKLTSTKENGHFHIKAHLLSPKSKRLSFADVRFSDVYNMNGTLNTTTPFPQLSYAGTNFEILTQKAKRSKRYVQVFWPNNTALLDSDYTDSFTSASGFTRKVNGKVLVEIPLATRHLGEITYGYEEIPLKASGLCLVDYNRKRILDATYKCDSESRAGFNKDVIDIAAENVYLPLGIHYIREFEYSGGNDGTNYPTIDKKTADVFQLNNRTNFNLKGILEVKTTHTGKDVKMTAIHANRTVHFDTNYHFLDREFRHSGWLRLDPQVWGSYDLRVINKTVEERDEEHAIINLSYPKRNFTVTGYLKSDKQHHESELKLDWDRPHEPKTIGAGIEWWRVSRKPDQQVLTISFKHPSFVKDVTFNGTYIRHGAKSLFAKLDVDYSNQTNKKLTIEGKIQDLSNPTESKYKLDVSAKHPATKLNLLATGTAFSGFGLHSMDSIAQYERSFLTLQRGNITAMIDTRKNEINYHKRFQREETYLRAKFRNDESCCSRLNGTVAKSEAFNYSGDFFIDMDEKIIEFLVNMTPDALETFHASGRIPDVRNAHLNVWRDFDDVTISDISFYLKLNHSRLVTSRLKWRPKLHKEVLGGIEYVYTSLLKHAEDTLEYWKMYTRSEMKEAIYDIWLNSKSDIQEFLNDFEALKSLEEDIEGFKKFLNDSYNNNDFYVKDITGRIVIFVDELAINGHVQALPDILNEMWQVMGESGEAIRNSIVWIIETVKTSYRKAMDFLRSFIKGDSTEQISALITNIIDKYDKMVKDLQVTVVRHLEQLWNNFLNMISEYWEFFLKSVEPTFIKFAHYAETAFLQASNEIMDFLYERKVELIKSPYFAKLANFTADFDKFYKDITKNSTISNIKKYSVKFYGFLSEKYFTIVPFGKEIQEILEEIVSELKELNKLPSINYLVTKTNDLYNKFVWIWESLDLEAKAQAAVSLVHSKLIDGTRSALDADIRYRKAKTKFVLDVDEGIVLLEQKLPMSWHAFNETPRFEEIPEYRAVAEFQKYLAFSNKTFWTFYHEYKPYTEIQNWFPPFKAQAIVAGSQFFMTFDKSFYEFRAPCEYLLAHDFVNGNFSLMMTKESTEKPDHFILTLVSHDISIAIDMFTDTVRLPKIEINHLPAEFGNLFIYKETGVITVEDKDGYILQCNVQFKVCSLTLSGWYFGKTAGLLGTMDHEKTTDFLTPGGLVEKDVGKFARSWALNGETCSNAGNLAQVSSAATTLHENLFNTCVSLFKSKNSQFSTCFSRVNAAPFMTMCLKSRKSMENSDVCTAAVAYSVACQAEYTPLPVPDFCVQCKLSNGKTVPEGEYFEMSGSDVPRSTDVVFIIEAKDCNRKLFTERNIEILHATLSKELVDKQITDNRFAIVVFGGDGVYDRPRTLLLNENVFNAFDRTGSHYWNFPVGNGNEDIFEAIAFASRLPFRPAVSKTFIVLPCSNCDDTNMTIEYSALREVLLDGSIKLHILMNSEFIFEKQRVAKIFYGIDGRKAYTKKDFKMMRGDNDLRRQAKLPKSILGYCAPLALETNGTVFSALKLEGKKKNAVKKFASVFGKRVAQHADPSPCQKCECSRYESGVSYMDCHPCEYPSPANIDLCLNDYGCDFTDSMDLYDEDVLRHPDGHQMQLDGESSES